MRTIPFVRWIANAAARFTGPHGAVTEQAQQTGCSRQCVYDHAQKVLAAVEAQHGGGPTREQLIQENEALRRENAQLWDWLCQTIEFPLAKQQEFAVTALAMGLSLNQTLVLLAILLGARGGSRSLDRASLGPGRRHRRRGRSSSGWTAPAKTLVLVGCLDEIFFHRRPVLVGVEPHSMVWFLGTKADDRQGSTWFGRLAALDGVALRDLATRARGSRPASPSSQQHRRQTDASPAGEGPGRLPHQAGGPAGLEGPLEPGGTDLGAGRGGQPSRRTRRNGRAATRGAWPSTARAAWKKAAAAFQRYEQGRGGLEAGRAGPEPVSSRWSTERSVVGAGAGRRGPAVAVGLRVVQGPWVPPGAGVVHVPGSAARRTGPTRGGRRSCAPPWCTCGGCVGSGAGARTRPRSGAIARWPRWCKQVLCQQIDPNWRESYRQVAAVLGRAVRASSAVECMNSVLRMHQSRHRTLTQGMLDLKRLYWNTRVFRRREAAGPLPV